MSPQDRTDLIRNLHLMAMLPYDFDGYEGHAPVPQVIAAASDCIQAFVVAGVEKPEISVAGDGEIAFRWVRDNTFSSICLLEDGCLMASSRYGKDVLGSADEPFNTPAVYRIVGAIKCALFANDIEKGD